MIPPFVISLDLEIDIHGEPTGERNSPDGLAAGDRPDELRQSAVAESRLVVSRESRKKNLCGRRADIGSGPDIRRAASSW